MPGERDGVLRFGDAASRSSRNCPRQQLDILGEHREQTAHQGKRDGFGIVERLAVFRARFLEMLGDLG